MLFGDNILAFGENLVSEMPKTKTILHDPIFMKTKIMMPYSWLDSKFGHFNYQIWTILSSEASQKVKVNTF